MDTHRIDAPTTLVGLLRSRAERQPDQVALRFLQNGESETESLTFGQMDRQARAIGAWLRRQGAAGERVLLLHRPGLSYITAFFGCLYAGAAAVPAYPPRNAQMMQTLGAIVTDAGAVLALTDDFLLPRLQATPLAGALPIHRFQSVPSCARWRTPQKAL
jgi:acyl-CoA synthetase (AMP-forming)/AMP-acid ligase II